MNWHEYFLRHVYLAASKSKDQHTQIGAVIVYENTVISEGYNGLPRGVFDYAKERQERPEKYFWFEHGERNAIYNCARHGSPTSGTVMYTQGIPCADCARGVIQAGIKIVYIHKQWSEQEFTDVNQKWDDSCGRSKIMFAEAGVEIIELDIPLELEARRNGKIFRV